MRRPQPQFGNTSFGETAQRKSVRGAPKEGVPRRPGKATGEKGSTNLGGRSVRYGLKPKRGRS